MSVLRDIFSGTLWVVAARWTIRGMGLISTLVLARVLAPADFGIVAMAMVVVGMIEVFGESGLTYYIIRHPAPRRSHFDTVWTLRLLLGAGMAIALVTMAPAGAAFFHEARVEPVLRVLALRPLLIGLENPGIILFRKEMIFSKDFEFLVLNKIVSFAVTVILAIALMNYWALVAGIVVGGAASTLQSYRMHPYRPQFDLSETRAIWKMSFWILLQSMLMFLNTRLDELIIGRVKSTAAMGTYSVALDVSSSPILEITAPLSRALFPGISKIAEHNERVTAAFEKVLAGVAIIAVPVSVGLALVAPDFTALLLGEKWMPIVPLLPTLAISAGILALSQPVHPLLNATNNYRVSAMLSLIRQALLAAAMVPAAIYFDLQAVALARAAAVMAVFALSMVEYVRLFGTAPGRILAGLGRPLTAAVLMSGAVFLVQTFSPTYVPIRLAFSVTAGALVYSAGVFGLWGLFGKPDDVEGDLVSVARAPLRKVWERVNTHPVG